MVTWWVYLLAQVTQTFTHNLKYWVKKLCSQDLKFGPLRAETWGERKLLRWYRTIQTKRGNKILKPTGPSHQLLPASNWERICRRRRSRRRRWRRGEGGKRRNKPPRPWKHFSRPQSLGYRKGPWEVIPTVPSATGPTCFLVVSRLYPLFGLYSEDQVL